jgi:hydrogenase large subunit
VTQTNQSERPASQPNQLVEMSWDPITRIVGSLGIYTKIDFANREVASATAPRRSSAATASS